MKELTIILLLVYIVTNKWDSEINHKELLNKIEILEHQNKIILAKIDMLQNQATLDSIDNNLNK